MHLPLQNRQRHCIPPANLRQPLHTLPIPHSAPPVFTILAFPSIAHTPDIIREQKPHAIAAQSDKPRSRDLETGYGEVQDSEASLRSGNRGRKIAAGEGAISGRGARSGGGGCRGR